jgi:hypothetical protein
MKLSTIILPAVLVLSGLACAQDKGIYKCTDPEGVVYRDTPCTGSQEQTLLATARKTSWQTESPKPSPPIDARLVGTPLFATRIFIGMTDTQVLNLPGWGKPARIVRSRNGHAWREQWVYRDRSTGDERRLLYFENARLVDQEDAPASASIQARATID